MKRPDRICIIAEGQLGDLLILSPALRALKESFPRSHLTVLVLQRRSYGDALEAPLLREAPEGGTTRVLTAETSVDAVAEIDRGGLRALRGVRRLRAELSVIRWLRRGKFDAVICTFPQDRFYLWSWLSGASLRVGEAGRPLSRLLTRTVSSVRRQGGVLEYYCALAAAAGAPVTSKTTRVTIPAREREMAEERWKSLGLPAAAAVVAIHPGASGAYRIWPPDSWAGLIDALGGRGVHVILLGSEFDARVVGEVARLCALRPCVAYTRDVLELAAILAKCALCVSNNSGPRHLAVAAGVRSLAVIPRFDDAEWKIYTDEDAAGTMQSREECPACPPSACLNTLPPGEEFGSYCMRALGVAPVLARTLDLLGLPPGGPDAPTSSGPEPLRTPSGGSGPRSPGA